MNSIIIPKLFYERHDLLAGKVYANCAIVKETKLPIFDLYGTWCSDDNETNKDSNMILRK